MPGSSPRKSQLLDFQRRIAEALMRPLAGDESMARENALTAEQLIKPNDRLSSFERLQIYNQQYWWRVLGTFGEDFHGLRAVLGARKFDRLATAYLQACPSTSWSLRDLGSRLESFLLDHPDLAAPHTALALEMVRVEWARIVAFDGPELPPLDPRRVANISPDRLTITLQPYLTLLELRHPIDSMLAKLKVVPLETGRLSNAVAANLGKSRRRLTARPRKSPVYLAVHRHDFSVFYKRLEPGAFGLLSALRGGATLEDACGAIVPETHLQSQEVAAKIQGWFGTWMQLRWLA